MKNSKSFEMIRLLVENLGCKKLSPTLNDERKRMMACNKHNMNQPSTPFPLLLLCILFQLASPTRPACITLISHSTSKYTSVCFKRFKGIYHCVPEKLLLIVNCLCTLVHGRWSVMCICVNTVICVSCLYPGKVYITIFIWVNLYFKIFDQLFQ